MAKRGKGYDDISEILHILDFKRKQEEYDMLRIGMLTSGGDCQAFNAAMRGVAKTLFNNREDVEIYGFLD